MNWIQKFLILCSGANLSVLKKTRIEWNKQAGVGGVILFTAIFASLSAGYALYTVFDNYFIAVIFSLLWGAMIFNLDRFIVSSMKKTGSFSQQFLTALPRLILAFILGVVISKPLELKIFNKEIDRQLEVIINRNKAQLQDSMNLRFKQQTLPYQTERDSIQNRINNLRKEIADITVEREKEIIGTGTETTSGKAGYGPNAKRKDELLAQKKDELNQYYVQVKNPLDTLNAKISQIYANLAHELKTSAPVEEGFNGFAARMQALDELGKANSMIALASFFIMLVFIVLEMSPVFVKLISPSGAYDYLMDKEDFYFKQYAREMTEKERLSSEYRIENHKNKLQKE
ncbi:MAG: DUF4407 domain-containing protein [Flavobacteriaceae bacterium]|jgi:hypothetical protein|nr:DUF4407 domain-containing protein [Flavobacteriaceae bacterium]